MTDAFSNLRYFSAQDHAARAWEKFYRNRWQHDKVVRSTHGVNCTGSCSWKIFVKKGIVTWEIQATDYPVMVRICRITSRAAARVALLIPGTSITRAA